MQILTNLPDLNRRFRSAIVWNLLAAVFNQGSTFVANIFLARILHRDVYGQYSILAGTLLSLSILLQFSLGYTATKYVAEFRSSDPVRAGRIAALCIVIGVAAAVFGATCLFLAADTISARWLHAPQLALPLKIGAVFLFFSVINGMQTGIMAGLENYRGLAYAGVLSGIFAVGLMCLGGSLRGLAGAMMGLSIGGLLRFQFHQFWLRAAITQHGIRYQFNAIGREMNVFFQFALPAVLAGYVYLPVMWLASTALVRQDNGFAEMGAYGACNTIRMLALFLPNVINNVGLAILNHSRGQGDAVLCAKVARASLWTMAASALMVALLISSLGGFVLRMFGRDFTGQGWVLGILVWSALPESLGNAMYQHIQAEAKMWLALFGIIIPWQIAFAAMAFTFIPKWGATGMALAYLGGSCVQAGLTAFHAARLQGGIRLRAREALGSAVGV